MSISQQSYEPPVGMMVSAADVYYALASRKAQTDPNYAKAVLRSYVEIKLARGKTKNEASMKLELLERQLPQFVRAFHAVRAECGLRASRIFPPLRPAPTSTTASSSRTPSSPSTVLNRRTSDVPVSTNPRHQLTTVRAADLQDGDPPPPPYASVDPDPESTRLLHERLASEAHAAAESPTIVTTPLGRSTSSTLPATALQGRSTSPSTPMRTGESPRSSVYYPSPSSRVSNLRRQSATASLSTTTMPSATIPPTGINGINSEEPGRVPMDPQEAAVWEESQLEEAKRASRAAEQERRDYEEAIRLSLVEAEARDLARAIDTSVAGPSTGARPGGHRGQAGSALYDDEDDNYAGGSARRVSSYNPMGKPALTDVRRSTSDAHRVYPDKGSTIIEDMSSLSIPGSWQSTAGKTSTVGSSVPTNHNDSIMDMLGTIDFSVPPMTPTKPTIYSPPLQLTPNKTGTALQSNNPFLSPEDPQEAEENTSINGTLNQPPNAFPKPVSAQPSNSSLRNVAGLPLPISQRALPSPPDTEVFDPPAGPPPGWRGPLPGQNSPPLPPLPVSPPPLPSPTAYRRLPIPGSSPPAMPPRPDYLRQSLNVPSLSVVPPSPLDTAPVIIDENALEMLREYDTVFLVDDSSSMAGERWVQAKGAIMGVVNQAARYDQDGVDIYFLNSKRVGKELRSTDDVEELFAGLEPRGATPTGYRLEVILREYMLRLERATASGDGGVKPMNLIVVTDGELPSPSLIILHCPLDIQNDTFTQSYNFYITAPSDDPESVLIACAKRLDRGDFPLSQVGVQLLQVGDDEEARQALQELDDGLASLHGIRDMVDTVPYSGEQITTGLIVKVLLGGINRRLDRRKA